MAIVGTAYLVVQVISTSVGKNIKDALKKAERDVQSDSDRLGGHIGDNVDRGTRRSLLSRLGSSFSKAFSSLGAKMRGFGQNIATRFEQGSAAFEKAGQNRATQFISGFAKKMRSAIPGFSKMGTIIMAALTAGPSLLAGASVIVTAYGASIISLLSALGPAAAGAGVAFGAAFAGMMLTTKLLKLALDDSVAGVKDLKKQMTDLKTQVGTAVAGGLLPGLKAAVGDLQKSIPALHDSLVATGAAVGAVAQNFTAMITSASNVALINTILQNNAAFTKTAGAALTQLAQAFLLAWAAAKPLLDVVAGLLTQFANWALATIQAKNSTGELAATFTRWAGELQRVVDILKNFAIGIANVFKAAQGSGGTFLTSIESVAKRFKDFTSSADGQNKLKQFFDNMVPVVQAVNRMIGSLGMTIGKALGGADTGNVLSVLSILETQVLPSLIQMFQTIQASTGDALVVLFKTLADTLQAMADSGALGSIVNAMIMLGEAIQAILTLPFGAQLVSMIAQFVALMTIFGPLIKAVLLVVEVVQVLWPVLAAIGGALGWWIVVIVAVVAALILLWRNFDTVKAAVISFATTIWNALVGAFNAVVDAVTSVWEAVTEAFSSVVDTVGGSVQSIWEAVTSGFGAVIDFFSGIGQAIGDALSTAFDFVVGVFRTVFGVISTVVSVYISIVMAILKPFIFIFTDIIPAAINVFLTIWSYIWPILALPVRVFYGLVILFWNMLFDFLVGIIQSISDFVGVAWNAIWENVSAVVGTVVGAIQKAFTAVRNFLVSIFNSILNFIVSVWNSIYNAIASALNRAWAFIVTIWSSVATAIRSYMAAIWSNLVSVWNAIYAFVSSIVNSVVNSVRGPFNAIKGIISSALSAAHSAVVSGFNAIVNFVSDVGSRIRGIVSNVWGAVGNVGDSIVSGARSALNGVISGVNTVISGLNSVINAANQLPGPDIPNVPSIPHLAKGGVIMPTSGGTLAVVAEAGRAERVEPLDSDGLSKRDRAWLNQIGSGGDGEVLVQVFIGDTELNSKIDQRVIRGNTGVARSVLAGRRVVAT